MTRKCEECFHSGIVGCGKFGQRLEKNQAACGFFAPREIPAPRSRVGLISTVSRPLLSGASHQDLPELLEKMVVNG